MSNIIDGVNPANIAGVTAARELLVLPSDVTTGAQLRFLVIR